MKVNIEINTDKPVGRRSAYAYLMLLRYFTHDEMRMTVENADGEMVPIAYEEVVVEDERGGQIGNKIVVRS